MRPHEGNDEVIEALELGAEESRSASFVVPRGRPADRSQASGCGSRFSGQAAPGSVV